ncbi:MAG: chemotaxis response regulator protein-glutamate methylesterase [Gammaproteobacteria bacterium]|nr:chemotaxis response regulator protein-glutamate methylesterase [Gammaproteobacteria bacterium]
MIKVLIVDDSALIRQLMTHILSEDPQIEVVGVAHDPFDAREKIKKLHPDVLTLDVEMPKMDGVTFLRNLMRLRPMPVVMVSTLTESGADVTLEALELGAVDYISKPKVNVQEEMKIYAAEIKRKVKMAARAKVRGLNAVVPKKVLDSVTMPPKVTATTFKTTDMIIAIGASTGGTEALKDVLCQLPATCPGIVITQHIPEAFSLPFSQRLDKNSAMKVYHAKDGQQILPGHVYLAPGNRHLEVVRDGARFICKLLDTDRVNRHKPSVEVMFNSVAKNVGKNAMAVMLTGMGDDGSDAMGVMRAAGAKTIAQDEATSVVWGMPGEAVKRGHVDFIEPLHNIAAKILEIVSKR